MPAIQNISLKSLFWDLMSVKSIFFLLIQQKNKIYCYWIIKLKKREREREGERNKNKPSLFYKFSLYRTRSVAPKVIRSPSILFYHSQNLIFLKRLVSIKQRGNKVILGEICLYLQNVNVHIWYSGEHFISAIFLKCKF